MSTPFRNFDDSDDDSDDGDVVFVSSRVPVPKVNKEYPCNQCPEEDRPIFKSHAELVKHKAEAEHEYCKKCDQEFECRDDLEMHILRSNRHITCFLCIKEFRSESGLQLHTQQAHRTSASALCPRCHENFATQAGLLQHIEQNLCAGGLRRGEIYGSINDHQYRTNEELRNRSGTGTETSTGNKPDGEPADPQTAAIELVNSFSHFKIYDTRPGTRDEEEEIKIDTRWWNEHRRHYNCPFRNCGKKFKNSNAFQQHLNSDAHTAKNFSCPGCKKRFPSSSAMLQHVESGMCRIMKTADYERVKDGLTFPVDQNKPSQSVATRSQRSEALSTVGAASDTGEDDRSVGGPKGKGKAVTSGSLSTVGTRPTTVQGYMAAQARAMNNKTPNSVSSALSTVGTKPEKQGAAGMNHNQFAERQLQQLKSAWGESNTKDKGKGKVKVDSQQPSEPVRKRTVVENQKPEGPMEYSFDKDSDSELSTVL
ncbi:hypothetical protein TWF730_006772 [Orbilia blumenaviensis]|uniref:C2H2-type domain-containing protein n=1 Tax=Orbilia blumenaviensis TaxID=1796055 RepID=A0AAV9VI73_9PEZI